MINAAVFVIFLSRSFAAYFSLISQ